MFNENLQAALHYISREAGLLKCPRFYKDARFVIAVIAGVPVLWLIHGWVPIFSSGIAFSWSFLFSVIIWYPAIEELLFRGVVQGQLLKYQWGRQSIINITLANVITAIIFSCLHMLHMSLYWSLAILVPALLFGYFRERYNSVYPSIVLHSVYNAFVIAGLVINGNLLI